MNPPADAPRPGISGHAVRMFVIEAFSALGHITHSPHCAILVYVPPFATDHGAAPDGIMTVRAENLQRERVLLLGRACSRMTA